MPNQRKSKSLTLKTINEREEAHDSSDEDVVKKDVAYLAKNFLKVMKFKNSGKFGDKRKFTRSGNEKKDFKKREGRESQSTQEVTCFECNGHGHFKKECPNYLRSKSKAYATTLSDSDSSISNSEDSCDEEGNFSAFMTIAHVKSSKDLNLLVQKLGEHSDEEFIGIVEESDAEEDEDTDGLQENYNSLLEKSGEYARVAKATVKKMKKAEDYRSLLVRYKEAKCEIETLNGELIEAYTKVRFLKHEVVQANAKVKRVSTKKFDDVLSSQNIFSNKTGLGYTGESSSAVNISKEVKFVKAKEPVVVAPIVEKTKGEKKKKNVADQQVLNKPNDQSVVRSAVRAKSLPRSQKGPRMNHLCHHCEL